ncbi:MAG: hypothetical protein R2834_17250 [Rhodothermales bacterium]
MRALQEVSINGISGLGYAEVVRTANRAEECRGVIVFDEAADVDALERAIQEKGGVYSGIVYAPTEAHVATFPIKIRHFEHEVDEPGATFVASAMPV